MFARSAKEVDLARINLLARAVLKIEFGSPSTLVINAILRALVDAKETVERLLSIHFFLNLLIC
jgi:hypothetical protein